VVEIILERITNVAMGTEIDNVTEFEETIDLPTEFCPDVRLRKVVRRLRGVIRQETVMPQFAANVTTPFLEPTFLDCFGAANEAGSPGVEYPLSFDFDKESSPARLIASRICGWQTIPGRNDPGSREINSGFVFEPFDQLG
jgi:hypothetical protein